MLYVNVSLWPNASPTDLSVPLSAYRRVYVDPSCAQNRRQVRQAESAARFELAANARSRSCLCFIKFGWVHGRMQLADQHLVVEREQLEDGRVLRLREEGVRGTTQKRGLRRGLLSFWDT